MFEVETGWSEARLSQIPKGETQARPQQLPNAAQYYYPDFPWQDVVLVGDTLRFNSFESGGRMGLADRTRARTFFGCTASLTACKAGHAAAAAWHRLRLQQVFLGPGVEEKATGPPLVVSAGPGGRVGGVCRFRIAVSDYVAHSSSAVVGEPGQGSGSFVAVKLASSELRVVSHEQAIESKEQSDWEPKSSEEEEEAEEKRILTGRRMLLEDSTDKVRGREVESHESGETGRVQQSSPFFVVTPYVNVVVFDSHDTSCDKNYESSPPVSDSSSVGYPADGTDRLRQNQMACGRLKVARWRGTSSVRFQNVQSNLPDYDDTTVDAKMQVRITCQLAFFIESLTCENVLDATGNFPRIVASQNSFILTTEFDPITVIEGTKAPVDISFTVPHAKDETECLGGALTTKREASSKETPSTKSMNKCYITAFDWTPPLTYTSAVGASTLFTFGIRTFGKMVKGYNIDVVAYPTDVWKLGTPETDCMQYDCTHVGTTCQLQSFQGAASSESNGFRIGVGTTPMINLGSTTSFSIRLSNPMESVNMFWTATSFRKDENQLRQEPYTVLIDKPIGVMGTPVGGIAEFEISAVGVEQWVTLEFKPGNTVMPRKGSSGILVIIPPESFYIIPSATPQAPDPEYNQLPCATWPEPDRMAGRWLCTLTDVAPFKDTYYRVKLKVRNPLQSGAAQGWRIEAWQTDASKPVTITRGVRGMDVSGPMTAALAQDNQLLGAENVLRFDFTPSQPIGNVNFTRLRVKAPPGFVIIKRCEGFYRIELPSAICVGTDSNSFELVFDDAGAIQPKVQYSFQLQVTNPVINIPDAQNIWEFDTLRPDGVPRDTARYPGFFLYPYAFSAFVVMPVSRKIGSQQMIMRFISGQIIPFDDYIRIRAPVGVSWDATDLQFSTAAAVTLANGVGAQNPNVDFDMPHILVCQLTTSAQANFEYGISANAIIPLVSPVPNRWWIEQYRRTGLPPPNSWRYMASKGADGFKTQVLVNTKIEPYNIVVEGWQNPTMFVFETTMEVMPFLRQTASGTELVPAEVYVEAPPMFTYICPLSTTVYPPPYTTPVPSDVKCLINHNTQATRNKLVLQFPGGLKGSTRYVFTLDVVNARFVDPILNKFTIQTRVDKVVYEEAVVQGFQLAARMDNTRYIAGGPDSDENRRVENTKNVVTFIIGTTQYITTPTVLEVKAPTGFKFAMNCNDGKDNRVGQANMGNLLPLPRIDYCQGLASIDVEKANIAHLQMTGTWNLGSYGLFVTVQNPMFTPLRNFWGFTIRDRDLTPRMSESWVFGFQIQVVLNPQIRAYNMGNGVDGEAAINYIDVSLSLTTEIPAHPVNSHILKVTAPPGFVFPNICRGFEIETFTPGYQGLPKGSRCTGNGAGELKISLPTMNAWYNKTNYMFRALVINPSSTFTEVDVPDKWWRIETTMSDDTKVDLNRVIPSFPIMQRLRYFDVSTLSKVGLDKTTFRIFFRTDQPLPPQQTVHIYPPLGTVFGGLKDGACIDEDPVLISRRFPTPLISGVTRLPEWVSCKVISPTELMLRNEEPILGGRPLISGPVFELFIKNASNPESTPQLNLFRIMAKTSTPLGQEVWTAPGWVVFPELTMTSVKVTNPGFGLYTNFTISMQTITEVPEQGSIRIVAPADHYFGPVIETETNRYDPLKSQPAPQGAGQIRPSEDASTICHILRTPNWVCPLEFIPCRTMDEIMAIKALGVVLTALQEQQRVDATKACTESRGKCVVGGRLSDLITCRSLGSALELDLATDVVLPSRRLLSFIIQGYNARVLPLAPSLNTWQFMTRNSDSEKTVLDEKPYVPGTQLIGIIAVDSIVPSSTKVGSIENYVTITLRLTTPCEPRAVLRITHPMDYMRGANAAFSGPAVSTGVTFPRQLEIRQSQNVIELEAIEETIVAGTALTLTLGMSNPQITPPRQDNIWTFEAFSAQSGTKTLLNCALNITGFKIFGEFSGAYVTGTVLSPNAQNMVGVWFSLKSILAASASSQMKIWMPKGWVPLFECGGRLFSSSYNPNKEGVKNPFPSNINYFPLPSGTECYDKYDEASEQYYILLRIDGLLDYGLDFAFEFAVTNPRYTPLASDNVWRFETLQNNVILHLRNEIEGFELEQIKDVRVTPSDTTTLLPLHRVEFYMMSDKYITGGSKIEITAPSGYIFTCAFFETDAGLAITTFCYKVSDTVAELTMDTADPKTPNSPFRLFVFLSNPEFTPQKNLWNFRIISPLGKTTDMRDFVGSYDITGKIQVEIRPTFPFLGQLNPLRIVFVQTSILNQADMGNEFVITAPEGFLFPANCTDGFRLRLSNQKTVPTTNQGYDVGFTFPPAGMTCTGYDNATVSIRFPDGSGLLRNNYTLEVDVMNPPYQPNATTIQPWSFITRVLNVDGERIVDANRTLMGFDMSKMAPMIQDEGAAERVVGVLNVILIVVLMAWGRA
ncbi:unnamed protein product [Polarella glacialis]|uniref:Uncharacterized protein n=1 Tax=Polarella glacialis TaxID=89957 RepID=A0A813DRS7_POLGL|nr:unnamed protein product [Polarella glacialis]